MTILRIFPQDFKILREGQEEFLLLDVREPWEIEQASFKEALCIPLAFLQDKASSLPNSKLIITVCHHGVRSLKAALILNQMGKKALSLEGGIEAYAQSVDPTMPRY